MKNIVIFYEHVVREYEACLRLKEALEADGFAVVEIFSLQYQLLECIQLARAKSFDAIVMPYVYTEKSLAPIKFLLKQAQPPIVFNFHHEQTASLFDEHKLLPRDNVAKNKVIHFVWSDFFKTKLTDLGIKDSQVFVTGNIRVNSMPDTTSRKYVADKYGLDEQKKWILLCESGNIFFSTKKVDELSSRGYRVADLVSWNSYVEQTISSMVSQFKSAPDCFFDEFELIYRDHPGVERSVVFSERVKRIDDERIGFWLPHVSAVTTRISTVLFEAEKFGVLAVRYDPEIIPSNLLPHGLERYPYIKKITDIVSTLKTNSVSDGPMVFEDYVGRCDVDVAEVMRSIIKNELTQSFIDRNSYRINLTKKYRIWPRLICNFFAPLVLKYGIKWNCRFCSSFSNIKRDGPPEWRVSQ